MKELKLSRGYVALVDDEDFEWVSQWKWSALEQPNGRVYAVRGACVNGVRFALKLHRALLSLFWKWVDVDHVNHDGLDNRRSNLRVVTRTKNAQNQRPQEGCSSVFKGVSLHKRNKKWQALIRVNRKLIYIGYFTSELDAARAYDAAARRFFGGCAYTNEEHFQLGKEQQVKT